MKTEGWFYMCGIVGVTGNPNAVEILLNGLEQLEYRGYDSAGIYVNDQKGDDYLVKEKGRIADRFSRILHHRFPGQKIQLTFTVQLGLATLAGQLTGCQARKMRTHTFQTTSAST